MAAAGLSVGESSPTAIGTGRTSARPRARPLLALLVFLLTFAAAGLVLLTRRPVAGLGGTTDEWFLLGVNLRLYQTLGLEDQPIFLRAPGYPLLISGALIATDALRQALGLPPFVPPRPEPVYFAQCLLLGLSASLLFVWLARACAEWVALVAALLFGLNPYSVILTGLLHYDLLHIFLLIASGLSLQRALDDPDGRAPALLRAGAVLGLATLVRSITLALPPFLWLLFLVRSGFWRGLRSAVLVTVGMAAVIAPWTARNYAQGGRLIAVNEQAWVGTWASTVVRHPMSPDRYLWSTLAVPHFLPVYQRVTGSARYQYGTYVRYNGELEQAFRRETLSNLRRQPEVYLHNVARAFLTLNLQINAVLIKVFQYVQQPGADVSQLFYESAPLAGHPSRTAAAFSWFMTATTLLAAGGMCLGLAARSPLALAASALYLCACLAHTFTYMDLMYYYVKLPFLFAFSALGLEALRRISLGRPFGRALSAAHAVAALLLGACLSLSASLLV